MAIAFLAGGVAGQELWRIALALLNCAFCSLAVGMLVGSFASLSGHPGFLMLVVAFLQGIATGPMTGWIIASGSDSPTVLLSGFTGAVAAALALRSIHDSLFWSTLLISHAGGWLLLFVAGHRCPGLMRQGGEVTTRWEDFRRCLMKIRLGGKESALLLDDNPAQWLAQHQRPAFAASWGLCVCAIVTTGILSAAFPSSTDRLLLGAYAFGWAFKLLALFAACSSFGGEKRDGTLALLLTTPLSAAELSSGYFLAIAKSLFPAILVALAGALATVALSAHSGRQVEDQFTYLLMGGAAVLGDSLAFLICGLFNGCYAPTMRSAIVLTVLQAWMIPGFLMIAFSFSFGVVGAGLGLVIGWLFIWFVAWGDLLAAIAKRKTDPLGQELTTESLLTHPSSEIQR